MADYLAEDQSEALLAPRRLGAITNWIGAGLSVALILGVAVWGYKLVMRDVNGIPVVRAAEGPMRKAPETPGGSTADHLGLAVNVVAATGTAAPPPDRLVLAPRPVELLDEDAPAAELMALAQILPMPQPQPNSTADGTGLVSPALALIPADGADAALLPGDARIETVAMTAPAPDSMSALVDQILAQVLAGEAPADGAPADETPAIAVPQIEGGIGQSLRPQARPAAMARAAAAQAAMVQAAVQSAMPVQDIDPATIPVGTRLVQLGAYDSPEVAKREWDRLAARFGDYLVGKGRVIQQAESGGRNFYRLRAMGFADINDSRRFCSALVAERAECIPVTVR